MIVDSRNFSIIKRVFIQMIEYLFFGKNDLNYYFEG